MSKTEPQRWRWKPVLVGLGGTLLIEVSFDHVGRFDLVFPTIVSLLAIGCVIAMRWELRRRVWFWVSVTVLAALHVVVILSERWPAQGVSGRGIFPVVFADVLAMQCILFLVQKVVGGVPAVSRNNESSRQVVSGKAEGAAQRAADSHLH